MVKCFFSDSYSSNNMRGGATMERISAEVFEEIYSEYSDRIYGYIFLLVNDKEVAEDLTQDTFIKAYKYMNQFNGESQIFTWLVRISRNVAIDYLRKKADSNFSQLKNSSSNQMKLLLQR